MKLRLLCSTPILTLFCLLATLGINAQTTYTFTGTGNWTDVPNWTPSYPGTTINIGDTVDIVGDVSITTDVTNEGTITNNGTIFISNPNFLYNNGLLHNTTSSVLTINSTAFIENVGDINNEGDLNAFGFITNLGTIANNDFLYNSGFIINYESGSLINSNLSVILNDDNIDNYGSFYNQGIVISDGPLRNYGTFFGIGIHERSFSNYGTLSPGNSPGTYTVNADYFQSATASLQMELETLTSFDVLAITDYAYLNGTLDILLLNNFTPTVGDTFTILTAGEITGTFATINLPSDYTWNVTYTETEVILEVQEVLSTLDNEQVSFIMYPNPASTQVTLKLNPLIDLEQVNVYNMLGQLVLTSKEKNINTASLSHGTYIVDVLTNKGKSSKKLIID
ncbi:T9SS type A sorting domain-containing protein [Psychroserpens sp. AS72]|uniref:T9SS type A sorting domain-containing protein n=1 Tax=Psychroserpens sp. AS72 TaxID=3135775 RepID=UPI0031814C43